MVLTRKAITITSEGYLKTANRFPQLSEYSIHLPCSYLLQTNTIQALMHLILRITVVTSLLQHSSLRQTIRYKQLPRGTRLRKCLHQYKESRKCRRASFQYSSHQSIYYQNQKHSTIHDVSTCACIHVHITYVRVHVPMYTHERYASLFIIACTYFSSNFRITCSGKKHVEPILIQNWKTAASLSH